MCVKLWALWKPQNDQSRLASEESDTTHTPFALARRERCTSQLPRLWVAVRNSPQFPERLPCDVPSIAADSLDPLLGPLGFWRFPFGRFRVARPDKKKGLERFFASRARPYLIVRGVGWREGGYLTCSTSEGSANVFCYFISMFFMHRGVSRVTSGGHTSTKAC